jgi:CheY-like chemotaxis protein
VIDKKNTIKELLMDDIKIGIMLVEDDQVDQMTVKRAFKQNKVLNPLYCAENGEEALAMLRGEGTEKVIPKIILLDLNMPKMGGVEFLEELRKDPLLKKISVFVLTTSQADEDIIATSKHNVAGYIVKPVSFDSFREAVKILDAYWTLCEFPNCGN